MPTQIIQHPIGSQARAEACGLGNLLRVAPDHERCRRLAHCYEHVCYRWCATLRGAA